MPEAIKKIAVGVGVSEKIGVFVKAKNIDILLKGNYSIPDDIDKFKETPADELVLYFADENIAVFTSHRNFFTFYTVDLQTGKKKNIFKRVIKNYYFDQWKRNNRTKIVYLTIIGHYRRDFEIYHPSPSEGLKVMIEIIEQITKIDKVIHSLTVVNGEVLELEPERWELVCDYETDLGRLEIRYEYGGEPVVWVRNKSMSLDSFKEAVKKNKI